MYHLLEEVGSEHFQEHFVIKHFLQCKRNMSCPRIQQAVCKPDLKLMEEQPSNCTKNIYAICFYLIDNDEEVDNRNNNNVKGYWNCNQRNS
jgi:hypothetical protein